MERVRTDMGSTVKADPHLTGRRASISGLLLEFASRFRLPAGQVLVSSDLCVPGMGVL
jgi:hypothetical protein